MNPPLADFEGKLESKVKDRAKRLKFWQMVRRLWPKKSASVLALECTLTSDTRRVSL